MSVDCLRYRFSAQDERWMVGSDVQGLKLARHIPLLFKTGKGAAPFLLCPSMRGGVHRPIEVLDNYHINKGWLSFENSML